MYCYSVLTMYINGYAECLDKLHVFHDKEFMFVIFSFAQYISVCSVYVYQFISCKINNKCVYFQL